MRPAIKIIFAPLFKREKKLREAGLNLHGKVLTPGRTMWLDPRSTYIVDTFVHEKYHIDHPSWTEEQVIEATKKKMARMTWKEHARILKLLGTATLEGESE